MTDLPVEYINVDMGDLAQRAQAAAEAWAADHFGPGPITGTGTAHVQEDHDRHGNVLERWEWVVVADEKGRPLTRIELDHWKVTP